MHYKCYVYTREFPSDEILDKALDPFYYEKEEEAPREFTWDWREIGGRYAGGLKLAVNKDDEKYEWNYLLRHPRAGRLFRSILLEFVNAKSYIDEHYHLRYCGLREGYILCDGAKISDLINFENQADECFCVIDPECNGYARIKWIGYDRIERKDFDKKAKDIYERCKDECYVTIVDIHN